MNTEKKYTWSEIKKHNKDNDAWIVIDKKVYDVTSYLVGHPGGPQWITKWLGKDCTKAYNTKAEMQQPHSDFANQELAKLQIGIAEEK